MINHRPFKKIDYSNYLYLLPAFLFYSLFVLYPLSDTIFTSFTEWSGIGEKKWVGLENYKKNHKIYVYGKDEVKEARKLGHINILS